MISTIAKATAAAGLLGITMLSVTPAMAATRCFEHNNPAACRARRDAHRMRAENRALRRTIHAQNRTMRRSIWAPYAAPIPIYNPYRVTPAPGLTIRF
jgi:hypothetical protein